MPIVDVELVSEGGAVPASVSAPDLADRVGAVFGSAPGRTWVRLRSLPASAYAENGRPAASATPLPVFVTVRHASPPTGERLAEEVAALTRAVAEHVGGPPTAFMLRTSRRRPVVRRSAAGSSRRPSRSGA